jgi:DNA invertase Pin-like site-specific DNA recombinase
MIKAYGYLRVSGTGQVEGDGFDRQRELISRFADQAGIAIPRFYEERGVSGAKGEEDRPAFQEMLTAILSNGVRAVIVERLDRLAREYAWCRSSFLSIWPPRESPCGTPQPARMSQRRSRPTR